MVAARGQAPQAGAAECESAETKDVVGPEMMDNSDDHPASHATSNFAIQDTIGNISLVFVV
eukprot:COSAG02_NODE_7123_length_3170_cov_2.462390_2_plen_61_part_00